MHARLPLLGLSLALAPSALIVHFKHIKSPQAIRSSHHQALRRHCEPLTSASSTLRPLASRGRAGGVLCSGATVIAAVGIAGRVMPFYIHPSHPQRLYACAWTRAPPREPYRDCGRARAHAQVRPSMTLPTAPLCRRASNPNAKNAREGTLGLAPFWPTWAIAMGPPWGGLPVSAIHTYSRQRTKAGPTNQRPRVDSIAAQLTAPSSIAMGCEWRCILKQQPSETQTVPVRPFTVSLSIGSTWHAQAGDRSAGSGLSAGTVTVHRDRNPAHTTYAYALLSILCIHN